MLHAIQFGFAIVVLLVAAASQAVEPIDVGTRREPIMDDYSCSHAPRGNTLSGRSASVQPEDI